VTHDSARIRLLIGTSNAAKLERIIRMIEEIPVQPLTPADLGGISAPAEHGDNPYDICRSKAIAYQEAAGVPALSVDSALYIDNLPPEEQPGVYVRRLGGTELSDDELIDAFCGLLRKHGGDSTGYWLTAVAVATSPTDVCSAVYRSPTRKFRTTPSDQRVPGEPLNSITFLPEFDKYYSELDAAEHDSLVEGFRAVVRSTVRESFGLS
jgi:inosine/xanthosine triphosphate pyrophosphatase family protein